MVSAGSVNHRESHTLHFAAYSRQWKHNAAASCDSQTNAFNEVQQYTLNTVCSSLSLCVVLSPLCVCLFSFLNCNLAHSAHKLLS